MSWLIAAVVAVTVNVTVMLPLLLWGEFSFGAVSVSVVEADCVGLLLVFSYHSFVNSNSFSSKPYSSFLPICTT